MEKPAYYHTETPGPGRSITHALKGPWLFDEMEFLPEINNWAHVQIGDFEAFGRGLVIDRMAQLSEVVDRAYTTALVYPAALAAPSHKKWLIAGGGDGAAAREALRFPETERVVLVEISPTVVQKTQELIPSFWNGAQNDPRLEIVHADVFRYIRESQELFDIILLDLTDPADDFHTPFKRSASDPLYTLDALKPFKDHLAPAGVLVAQAQELSDFHSAGHERLRAILDKLFPNVRSYRTLIEFFGYWQSFIMATRTGRRTFLPWDAASSCRILPGADRDSQSLLNAAKFCKHLESLFILPPHLEKKIGQ